MQFHRKLELCLTQVDIEDTAESFQTSVSNEASNIPSLNEEDNHSETASSGYASVQGTDEPVPEGPAPSESKYFIGLPNCTALVFPGSSCSLSGCSENQVFIF